jgi:hypothetical protein
VVEQKHEALSSNLSTRKKKVENIFFFFFASVFLVVLEFEFRASVC